MTKKRYSAEFKMEAARMIIVDGLSVKEVSEQLGVAQNLLYKWKQEHIEELEASNPAGARSPKAMAAELESLRKELAKARRMNEILKKTVGYFSKED